MEDDNTPGQIPKKSKYGRKKNLNPKIKSVRARYSEAEFLLLNSNFKKSSAKSLAEYVAYSSLEKFHFLDKEPLEILKYRNEVRKIGVNLNQIAKRINVHGKYIELQEELNKIEKALRIILRNIKSV